MYRNYYGIEFRNPFAEQIDDYSEYYCSEMLMNALALYVVSNRPECEHTDESVYKMLVSNSKLVYRNRKYGECEFILDALFEELETKNPCALELAYYKLFKAFPYKQRLSIIATLMASNFDTRKKMIDTFGQLSQERTNCFRNPNDIFISTEE